MTSVSTFTTHDGLGLKLYRFSENSETQFEFPVLLVNRCVFYAGLT